MGLQEVKTIMTFGDSQLWDQNPSRYLGNMSKELKQISEYQTLQRLIRFS